MKYRTYGKTGVEVSVLGFGCMRLPLVEGGDPTQINTEEAIREVRHAVDNGVNYLDTAYTYHSTSPEIPGESEPFVAEALKDGYRDKVKIATKLPTWLIKSRDDMDRILDDQLKRLNTDSIDFYLIHNIQEAVWGTLKREGMSDFLDKALKDGRIKHAGFSFHDTPALFKEAVDYYDWSFCQIMYNYLDEDFQAGSEGLDYAYDKGLGIAIMEPLRGGQLARKLPTEAQQVFDNTGCLRTPAEWALKWILNNPKVSLILSGMNSMEQINENLRTADETVAGSMTDIELAAVETVKNIFKSKYKINCTQCRYCNCPTGVDIPTCFSLYNNYHLYDMAESYKFTYNGMLRAANRRASGCIECGLCETHCPQQIDIREQLKKVSALFE